MQSPWKQVSYGGQVNCFRWCELVFVPLLKVRVSLPGICVTKPGQIYVYLQCLDASVLTITWNGGAIEFSVWLITIRAWVSKSQSSVIAQHIVSPYWKFEIFTIHNYNHEHNVCESKIRQLIEQGIFGVQLNSYIIYILVDGNLLPWWWL